MRTLYNGIAIPEIGMGTFGSDYVNPNQVVAAVACAVRLGYRLFDCASVYGNESQIGGIFAETIREGTVTRDELFVTSKV